MDDYPKAIKLSTMTYSSGIFCGLLIGGLTSYPCDTGIVNENSGFK